MSVRTRTVSGVAVLYVEGPLVTASGATPSLRAIVRDQLRQGCLVVLIDLAGVTDVDARGIGWLVSSVTTLERHGGKMAIVAPPACVRRLLAITNLDTVLTIYDSEREALIRNRPIVVPTAPSHLWPECAVVLAGGGRSDMRPLPDLRDRHGTARMPGEFDLDHASLQRDKRPNLRRIAK